MILHCWYVAKHDQFTSRNAYVPDTDEFLLLPHFYPPLSQSLAFHTGKGTDLCKIDITCHEAIGPSRVEALLEYYIFTHCDQTFGKSKTFWWKRFYKLNIDVLEALRKLGKIPVSCLEGKAIRKIFWWNVWLVLESTQDNLNA